jgi:hypothetical protein
MTLKARESMNGSFHPNSHGTRIRCPELEIGRNSVSPWVRPITSAWMERSMGRVLRVGDREAL